MGIEVFVDMDGPLADFDKAKRDHKLDHLPDDDMWKVINEKYEDWFMNLPPAVGWKDLWNVAVELDVNNDPIVLTACSKKRAYRGTWQKEYWLSKMFHKDTMLPPIIVCQRRHKADWADKNRLLVDDNEQTIKEWVAKGGIGVLYKNSKQAIEEMLIVRELNR